MKSSPTLESNENVYNETTFIRDSSANVSESFQKYRHELKHLLPYRRKKSDNSVVIDYAAQVDKINLFQYIFFTWMTPVVQRIYSAKFTIIDINTCSPFDSCSINTERFKRLWKEQCNQSGLHNASLSWAMFQFVRTRFLVASFFYILCLATGYLSSTFFVKKLLEEVENSLIVDDTRFQSNNLLLNTTIDNDDVAGVEQQQIPWWTIITVNLPAFKWTMALFCCELLRAIFFSIMFCIIIRTGIRCVNALNGIIYDKILTKLAKQSEQDKSIQSNNLFANDLWKVFQMIYMAPLMIGSPIIIVITIFYTIHLIGQSALYGMMLFVMIFVVQFFLTKKQTSLRNQIMCQSDRRLSLITQLMKCIRTIKFNAWESPFKKEIENCRQIESSIILRYNYLQCLSTSMALLTPMLITIINILVHTWFGHELSVSTAFSLVMLNYIAAHGIRSLPNYLREIVNGRSALLRIERFLRFDDQQPYLSCEVTDTTNAIEIIDASFSLSPIRFESKISFFKLLNINLAVPKKAHLYIHGPVGSGKTAFLLSVLGQTQCFQGQVNVFSDNVAYVSQTPWLQNGTIQENIVFGLPFNGKRYYETLMKCSLTEDISQLTLGENTVIGENGVQLSGGQKQRIALARAVYADSDIYLFDDFFSSLDSKVVKSIFTNVIEGLLKYKTILFVTNHLYLLKDNDLVALFHEGQINHFGKHSELLKNNEEYRKAVEQSNPINRGESSPDSVPDEQSLDKLLENKNEDEFDDDDDIDQGVKSEFIEQSDNSNEDNDSKEDDELNKSKSVIGNCRLKGVRNYRADSYLSLISLLEQCHSGDTNLTNNDRMLNGNSSNETKNYRKYLEKYSKSKKTCKPKDIKSDNLANNAISMSTYWDYIQASGGWIVFFIMVAMFAFQTVTTTFSNWWLSYWLNQADGSHTTSQNFDLSSNLTTIDSTGFTADNQSKIVGSILDNPNLHYYQSMYFLSFFIVIFTSLLMGVFFARIVVKASNGLHKKILKKVISSPISFFDSIKLGKIINLFSHNIDELDNQLPVALDGFLQRFLLVVGNFVIIIGTLYWFSFVFILFVVLFVFIFRMYRVTMYWLKQADMRLRSPIYSYASSTIDGLSTIKAFRREFQFTKHFHSLCDRQIAANFLSSCAVRWLSIRIDFLCVFASFFVCVLVLLNVRTIGSAYAGLVITQSLQLSGLLQLVIRLALELETRLVSVERVQAYIRLLRTEKQVLKEDLTQKLLPEWPLGRISFRNVCLRYRSNLPLALRNVTFDVQPGEWLAIVGRTGAGKSSISYALLRLVEISSGSIYIDGIDIQSIPLKILRHKLSIIPQDPVLFDGTIRKNLDPYERYCDADLITVIQQVKLGAKFQSLAKGLDELTQDNVLSTGEKQLFCLARALLQKCRIIIMDEATSSMDHQTEMDIWEIIRNNFASCTIILIAHRLHTVLNCDQVMVVRKGKIVEQGNPLALKEDTNSIFSQMISKS